MVSKKKAKAKARVSAQTFAGYFAALEPEQRAALERLQKLVLSVAPGAEECIGLSAARFGGKVLVWFGAMPSHLSFFPGGVVPAFQKELAAFSTSKGTIRFQADRPLRSSRSWSRRAWPSSE
jgi:uncharacterized protein YdhG (YjbR/CyaY superfamily)